MQHFIIKNSQEVVTIDDTPTDLFRFDVSLMDYLYELYGLDDVEFCNWQKWTVDVIAHTSIDGYAGECAMWKFELSCRWLNEATEIIDTLPLTPVYYTKSTPEADDWTVEFSDVGNDVIVTVTGEVDKNIYWQIITNQIVVSDQEIPFPEPEVEDIPYEPPSEGEEE